MSVKKRFSNEFSSIKYELIWQFQRIWYQITDLKQKKVGIWIREIKSKDTRMTWEGSTACLKEVETEYSPTVI